MKTNKQTMAKGIQSVDTAFKVLHALQSGAQPMLLKDLAAHVDMSASKTRMYLVSLLRTGLVSQNAASAYTLGPAALNLGLAAFTQIDLAETARTLMSELTQETQAPALLSMWTGSSITIIGRNDSLINLPIDFRIGGKSSLIHTATGHIYLAYLPNEITRPYVEQELAHVPVSVHKPITQDFLEERVRVIRQQGYDVSDEVVLASDPGVTIQGYGAIATPVVDIFQELRFVITALYRKSDDKHEALLVQHVLKRIRDTLPSPALQSTP